MIDMSECEDIDKDDHYEGLSLFMKYMLLRKKDNGLRWPRRQNSVGSDSELADKFITPNSGRDRMDQIDELLFEWRRQRFCYPGWEVIPENLYEYLWNGTQHWMSYVGSGDDLPDFVDLGFAFELNWRMQRCLCPILKHQIEFFESVLNRYWNPEDWPNAKRNVVAMCIDLQLSIMRFYREEGRLEQWEKADKRIEQVFQIMSSEQKVASHYERSLFCLV